MLNGIVSTTSKLIILKNRGGLKYASDDVNLICHTAKKILDRTNSHYLQILILKLWWKRWKYFLHQYWL